MSYIGANIYYWGMQEQRRLLRQGLSLWAREARDQGLVQHLWYCPFDVRSPHVFALFRAGEGRHNDIKTFLQGRIQEFLEKWPSHVQLNTDEVEQRHSQCRITMNLADRQPGPAPNNSFLVFEHAHTDYPFWLNQHLDNSDQLWRRLDEVAAWTLDHASDNSTSTAVGWLAAVDRSLRKQKIPAAEYWRFHAGTLLLGLEQSMQDQPETVSAWLKNAVSLSNQKLFARCWNTVDDDLGVDIDGLVRHIFSQPGATLAKQYRVLREVNHFTLLQLGQIVRCEIPAILYAWQRNL